MCVAHEVINVRGTLLTRCDNQKMPFQCGMDFSVKRPQKHLTFLLSSLAYHQNFQFALKMLWLPSIGDLFAILRALAIPGEIFAVVSMQIMSTLRASAIAFAADIIDPFI